MKETFNEIKRVLDSLDSYSNDERVHCFTKHTDNYRVKALDHFDNERSQKLQNLLIKAEKKLRQVINKIDNLDRNICISEKDTWYASDNNTSMRDFMWREIEKTNLDLLKASFTAEEIKEFKNDLD